jgi:AcrR family transcriptional regulator
MKPLKRQQILEISEKLFNRFGIRRTGVDEIARLANVAKGTIYNYFGDKEGLFRELIKGKIAFFEEMLEKSLGNVRDPAEKVKLTLVEHLKIIIDNPFLSDKLLYGSYEDRIKDIMEDLEGKTRKTLRRIIDATYSKKLMPVEKRAIVNSLIFALKGMDETIRGRLGSDSIKKYENDIRYMVRALMPKQISKVNGG